jgi:uncharacterized damage-inducible protein DinB
MTDRRLEIILQTLDPPPGTKPWYGGSTVSGCLRGVGAEQALWKPEAKRHSIWELSLHIAYWKYAVRRNILGSPTGGFPRSPSNWPDAPPSADGKLWAEDRRLLAREHGSLVDAIRAFDPKRLDERLPRDSKYTYSDVLMGIINHDLYHTGQIVLMKRLYKSFRSGTPRGGKRTR